MQVPFQWPDGQSTTEEESMHVPARARVCVCVCVCVFTAALQACEKPKTVGGFLN